MATTKSKDKGILGTIVTWKVPANVQYETLRLGLQKAKLDPELVRELAPYYALCRALADMRKGRVIRKLRTEDKIVHFQLTRETIGDTEATYDKEAEVSLNTKTGELTCAHRMIKQKAEELIAIHTNKRKASDVSNLMFRIYKSNDSDLIAIREQGGAYFVPDSQKEMVEKTKILFSIIGGNFRQFEVRLGAADTAESVAESMADYFRELVEDFKFSINRVAFTRGSVGENRMAQIAAMRQKLDLYRGLLRGHADHIADVIDGANKDLMRKIAESETEE
jgi:hypothetical protein